MIEGSAAGDLMGFVKACVLVMKMVKGRVRVVDIRWLVSILFVGSFGARVLVVGWRIGIIVYGLLVQSHGCRYIEIEHVRLNIIELCSVVIRRYSEFFAAHAQKRREG